MPVSCGRGLSSEKIARVAGNEEFDPEYAVAAEIVDDRRSHGLRFAERLGRHRHRLPALAIIAKLLAVADRRAEEDAVAGAHGEQGDLVIEGDELLDDHPRPVAAHIGDRIGPRRVEIGGVADRALAFARRRHDRLHDAGQAGMRGGVMHLLEALGEAVKRGREAQFLGGERADRVAVHRHLRGAGGRDDDPALGLQRLQFLGPDRLDLRHDKIRPVRFDRSAQRRAVEHRENRGGIRHLHRRRAGIGIAGDDKSAEPLGGDGEFAAELAGAEQQDLGGEGHGNRR